MPSVPYLDMRTELKENRSHLMTEMYATMPDPDRELRMRLNPMAECEELW